MLTLAGCGGAPSLNPVDWWHGLQGGPLAETRPPPPNADAPYPTLASIPSKPEVADATSRGKIASGLVADRANAQYAAGLDPLQPYQPPPAPRPTPATGTDEQPNATLNAAAAPPFRPQTGPAQPPLPPVAMSPPRRAPVGAIDAQALPSPASASQVPADAPSQATPVAAAETATFQPAAASPAATSPVATSPVATSPAGRVPAAPRPAAGAAAGPGSPSSRPTTPSPFEVDAMALPGMPDQPPPPVRLAGVALPRSTAPTPPPATPILAASPAPAPTPGAPVTIAFQPGSAALPPTALAPLRLIAQRHGSAPIAVTGFGEAASTDSAAQSAALPLALARARAIAANLLTAGVPASAIRVGAEAQGAGGAAQILVR